MREKLRRSRDRLIKLGIGTEALNFNMVVFQQDTKYSHLYRAQKAFFSNRVGFESVESLHYAFQHSRHFRITRLAELYERWVLVTLVRVLQTRFKLTLPTGWVSDFIRRVIRDEHNIRLEFTHPSWRYRIRLTYEYELPKQGTQRYAFRPDFVLELIDESRLEKRFPTPNSARSLMPRTAGSCLRNSRTARTTCRRLRRPPTLPIFRRGAGLNLWSRQPPA